MSKELTDNYMAKKLKKGWYWVKFNCFANIHPSFYEKGYFWDDGKVEDVVSPCDYEIMAHLETKNEWQAERIKELEQDVKTLTNNYKLQEKQQAEILSHGQALVDEFGDFEALYEELVRLRKEVAKGDEIIGKLLNEGHAAIEKNKQLSRLLKGRLEKALNNN